MLGIRGPPEKEAAIMSLTSVLPAPTTEAVKVPSGKDRSFNYILAFATLGMLVTLVGLVFDMDVASF